MKGYIQPAMVCVLKPVKIAS